MGTFENKVRADIASHGWSVVKIEPDAVGPGFAYTIGLQERFGHPEVIVVGLPTALAHRLINEVGEAIRMGSRYAAGQRYDDVLREHAVTFRAVPDYQLAAYCGSAQRHYKGHALRVVQLIYPDRQGKWPWAEDVTPTFRAGQPVLADTPLPDWAKDETGEDAS